MDPPNSNSVEEEIQSRVSSLEPFFSPKSVSIVGASATKGKLGRLVVENMIEQGFRGKMYPVNPNLREVLGLGCFPDLESLPEKPELSIVLIPAREVPQSLEKHSELGIKNIVVMSAGFKEIGKTGQELENALARIGKKGGLRIMGPNCLGIFDNVSRLDTFFIPRNLIQRPKNGMVSLASQSGSFVGHLMDFATSERLGIARGVTYGNRVDVDETDVLYFLARDPHTKIVGLYIEGTKNGQEFLKAARYCSAKKPLIALKTGKYETISRAISSHTGALAGSYAAYNAAFRKAGILEVKTIEEFVDTCKALVFLPRAVGKRVLILGHAGGLGLTIADHCLELGLEVPTMPDEISEVVRSGVLPISSLVNPIDLTASGTDEHVEYVLEQAFVERDFADIAIYMAVWGLPQNSERIASIVSRAMKKCSKPIVVASLQGRVCYEKRHIFENIGIPVFMTLQRAAVVASHLANRPSKLDESNLQNQGN